MNPSNVKIEYLHLLSGEDIPEQSTNKTNSSDNIVDIARVNRTLVHFFVCCGIPFSVVNSPFFQDFVKSLYFEYKLPKMNNLINYLFEYRNSQYSIKN